MIDQMLFILFCLDNGMGKKKKPVHNVIDVFSKIFIETASKP